MGDPPFPLLLLLSLHWQISNFAILIREDTPFICERNTCHPQHARWIPSLAVVFSAASAVFAASAASVASGVSAASAVSASAASAASAVSAVSAVPAVSAVSAGLCQAWTTSG